MNTLTPGEIRLRLFLTVAVAALGYLATNDTWIGLVGKYGLLATGFTLVVLQTIRGFIDKSESQREGQEPQQVEVTNDASNPVPVDSAPADDAPQGDTAG